MAMPQKLFGFPVKIVDDIETPKGIAFGDLREVCTKIQDDRCPKCGSDNIMIGAFPLRCFACGWHYLNRHPCTVCGEPATSAVGYGKENYYGCPQHPPSEEVRAGMVRRFAADVFARTESA